MLFLLGLGWGCTPTQHLKKGELLLQAHPAYARNPDRGRDSILQPDSTYKKAKPGKLSVSTDDLWAATKTEPNRSVLFFKPYLGFWNLGVSIEKYGLPLQKVYRWFSSQDNLDERLVEMLKETAGEPPVLVDTTSLAKDAENIKSLYFSRGFFNADVSYRIDTVIGEFANDKAKVTFLVAENEAYIIDDLKFVAEEKLIQTVLTRRQNESFLKVGDLYNESKLAEERNRISSTMRDIGFYRFSPSMVTYDIDTALDRIPSHIPSRTDTSFCRAISVKLKVAGSHKMYRVRNVRLVMEPSQVELGDALIRLPKGVLAEWIREMVDVPANDLRDSLDIDFMVYQSMLGKVNLRFLDQLIALRPGEIWTTNNEKRTQRRLQDLGVFKYALIKYIPNDSSEYLDVEIQTQFLQRYSFKAGLEGFTRNDQVLQSQLPGIGGEIRITDRYLFRGGEHLDLSANGNVAFYRSGPNQPLRLYYEVGAKGQLSYPRFLLPFQSRIDLTRFTPRTNLQATVNSQQRTEFDRTQLGVNWNYSWFHSSLNTRSRSSLSPYIINLIGSNVSPEFEEQIKSISNNFLRSFLELDYLQPRFSSRFSYKFTYSDYLTTRLRSTHQIQPVFEFGGNTPFLIDRIFKGDGQWKDSKIGRLFYGQFLKTAIEYKRFIPLGSRKQELVLRGFSGVVTPWNYATQVPFDARFFSGGTNGMRAWQSNSLGPGAYSVSELGDDTRDFEFLISPGGEVILEANAEYRANVYKFVELAIFSDVGNVWFLPGSNFQFASGKLSKDFYKQLGWDMGLGIRFDFSFFIFRVDIAQQIYAPDLQDFVVKSFPKDLGGSRFQVNFGIGYPF